MKSPRTILSLNKFRITRRVRFFLVALIVLAILTIGVFVVQALARTWGNTGTDYNTGASWSGGTAPGAGDVGQFNSAEVTQPNLSNSISNAGLYFSGTGSSGYDVTSSSTAVKFTLTGTGATGSGGSTNSTAAAIRSEITSGTNTVDAPIILGAAAASTQVFFQSAGGTLVVNGSVSSTNAVTLSIKGTGTIQLNGTNTFTNGSNINDAGTTLVIGNDSALSNGTFTMGSSGTLQAGGGARTLSNAIVLGGNTTISGSNAFAFNGSFTSSGSNSRTLTVSNTGGVTLAGNVFLSESNTLNRSLTINGTSAVSISGVIANNNAGNTLASPLTYSGSNTLTLSGANTYTGTTTVSAGTLKLNKSGGGTLPSSNSVTISGGTLEISSDQTISGLTMSSGTLLIDSGVTLTITGTYNVTGGTINNQGTIKLNDSSVNFPGSGVTVNNGTANTMSNLEIASGTVTLTSTLIISGQLKVSGGTFDQGAADLTANTITVSSGATLKNLGTGDLTVGPGNVSNAGTINYNANGTTCGQTDDILIRSDVSGTQRTWSGAGTFSFTDVDVKDQKVPGGVTPPLQIIANSSTNSGNNTGWTFTGDAACTSSTYTWVGGLNADWQDPTSWSPVRADAASATTSDTLIFDGTVTPGPIVSDVPTQSIAALKLTNSVVVKLNGSSTAPPDVLTVSGGAASDLDVPAGSELWLQGTNAIRIKLSNSSTGTVGGAMFFLGNTTHQLTAVSPSTVTFANGATFTTDTTYNSSTNPFGTGADANSSNNSIIFNSGSTYTHNNGGSPFGSPGPVVVFNTGSNATWLTTNGFEANGRTYANLNVGLTGPSGVAVALSASNSGNFQFNNLTINGKDTSNNSSLTVTDSGGASTITIQGDITSSSGTNDTTNDVSLTAGSGGIILNNTAAHTFSDSGNSHTITFGSNATVQSGASLTLQRNLIVTPTSSSVLSIRGSLSAGASGYVIGNLLKPVTGNTTFEVGTSSGYSPVSLSTVTGTGDFTVRANSGPMPNLLDNSKALQRYWTLANGGITSAILTFNYQQADVSGNEARYRITKDTNGSAPVYFPEGTTDNVDETNNVATTTTAQSTFSNWTLAEPNAVTVVRMGDSSSTGFNNGNLVKWQTGYEVDNLGFNVYRVSGGKLVRITPSIVAGSAVMAGRTPLTAGLSYTWFDAKGLSDSEYYVEDIDLNGTRTMHGPIKTVFGGNIESPTKQQATLLSEVNQIQTDTTRFVSAYPTDQKAATDAQQQQQTTEPQTATPEAMPEATPQADEQPAPATPVLKKGVIRKLYQLNSDNIPSTELPREENEPKPTAIVTQPTRSERLSIAQDSPTDKQRAIAAGQAVKIAIRKAGWYRVTQAELAAAGLDPNADSNRLQLYVNGVEIPIVVRSSSNKQLSPDGSVEFYGTGMDTLTSGTRTYYLVVGSQPGQRINGQPVNTSSQTKGDATSSIASQDVPSQISAEPSTGAYSYTVERKDKLIYFTALLNGDADNFFGPVITGTPAKQDVVLTNIDTNSSAPATLSVSVQGVTMQAHKVRVVVNGFEAGVFEFNNQEHPSVQFQVPRVYLTEGNNSITLASLDGDSDISFADYVRVSYWHSYRAENDALTFTSSHTTPLTLEGFTTSQIRVFNITNPDAATQVNVKVTPKGSGYVVKVPGGKGEARVLLAVADSQVQHPSAITANEASNLAASDNRADFIILTHRNFRDAVKPLADLRRSQGLETMVVDVEDVYDEFSFGAKSRDAIKDFLFLARNSWSLAPRYVLFVGDGSFDPRDYQGFGHDFVPTKLLDATFMETASDDAFVDFNGDGIADIAVGRLPVQTAQQAQMVIGRIVNYSPGQTTNGALLISDHLEGYNFEVANNQVHNLLPSDLSVTTVNRGNNPTAQVKTDIINAINAGPLLVNYAGHGSPDAWTGASILSVPDVASLNNGNRLPFFVIMTCLNGRFQDSNRISLAETLMNANNGGAIAVWASSGLTEPDAQSGIDQQLMRLLFDNGQSLTLGDAVRGAKQATNDMDVRRTWIFFGDPTMRIR